MSSPRPETSVVICCYADERFADVCEAIRSALDQTAPSEVVVVVDHNPPLKARLEALFPQAIMVENREARGLSGARNSGIAASRGALVVFLDDDAMADPAMVQAMQAATADPAVLGVGGHIVADWRGPFPHWFPAEFLWVVGCTYEGLNPGRVRNLIGAAMGVRRSVFDAVGGFDAGLGRTAAGLPLGCEETELCIRATRADPGGRFVYAADAVCRHKVSPARATWAYLATRCYAEGLSKASLAALVRSDAALSTERSYVLRVLPRGVLRGLGALLRGEASGLLRAGAIVVGFACTLLGYGVGRVRMSRRAAPALLAPTLMAAPASPHERERG